MLAIVISNPVCPVSVVIISGFSKNPGIVPVKQKQTG
jgi:hypothetical protein